jgi:ABC-type nitrate/sulfonate/bicarbonate transport system substrate-binding protein
MRPSTDKQAVETSLDKVGIMVASSTARPPTALTTMVFQGVQNLPLFAAQDKGLFARYGLAVDQRIAPSSQELRDGLAQGRYQIVHTSVDNAVAMAEHAKVDTVVVMGGDNGWNDLFVQPEIASYADLRGKTVVVDAPDTAFAFQLYQMLKLNGIDRSEIDIRPLGATRFRLQAIMTDKNVAGSMLNLPFSLLASKAGVKKLATATDVIGPYLSTTGFLLRSWAAANADTLVRYIQAYIGGLLWVLDAANKAEAIALLQRRLDIAADVAAQSYAVASDPKTGFMADARLDIDGFRNVLKLRAELHGDWGGTPPSPDRYLDLSYHARAVAGLAAAARMPPQ